MIQPRASVLAMEAYTPPLEGRRGKIRLDFNENTAGPPVAAAGLSAEELSSYPEYREALAAVAEALGIDEERLMLTNGTGEAIFLTAFTFIEPGRDIAVTSSPTFALIPHYLALVGARLTQVPSTPDFAFDIEGIERAAAAGAKLVMLASPDNPTGASLEPDTVRRWCVKHPGTLVVIDEAYAEYGNSSAIALAGELPNLLVLRTFSKAWGLAGLRLGAVIGDADLIGYLSRVRAPYSVNTAALAAARLIMPLAGKVRAAAADALARKEYLVSRSTDLGWSTHAASGNFFLLKAGIDASALCSFCRDKGVLLRDQSSKPGMSGIVRITVGTEAENDRLLECLEDFRARRALIFDLDDTLVDTSQSFDAVVISLVERYAKTPLTRDELLSLRAEGGFNDDWDATAELLRRRGIAVDADTISREGTALYLAVARDRERLLIEEELLMRLGRRHRLFIVTGRRRAEYAPIWGENLDRHFEAVYCRDDIDGLKPKPAPDILAAVCSKHGIIGGYYIGNAVDDMHSARGAGLSAIGVATTLNLRELRAAGAHEAIASLTELERIFML